MRFARAGSVSSRRAWLLVSAPPAIATSLGCPRRIPGSPTTRSGLRTISATGFGLCFLYLRNLKGHRCNHKRVYRIYRELELNLRIKPRKRIVREKPEPLTVPEAINHCWSMDSMHDQLADDRSQGRQVWRARAVPHSERVLALHELLHKSGLDQDEISARLDFLEWGKTDDFLLQSAHVGFSEVNQHLLRWLHRTRVCRHRRHTTELKRKRSFQDILPSR